MNHKNVVIFLGPPGVGKGTQTALLQERLGFVHVATGAMFRAELKKRTPLGQRIQTVMEDGQLVDDQTVFECVESHFLAHQEAYESMSVVLLDGVIRTQPQAEQIGALLERLGYHVQFVLYLTAKLDLLVARFASRWTCKSCDHMHSLPFSKAEDAEGFACESCGAVGVLYRRADDEPETVRERFKVYEKQTAPLVSFYEKQKMLVKIDALAMPEVVYARLVSQFLQFL